MFIQIRWLLVLSLVVMASSVHILHEYNNYNQKYQNYQNYDNYDDDSSSDDSDDTTNNLPPLNLDSLRKLELAKHNALRKKHGCPPLVINNTLNTIAQNYSSSLYALQNGLVHSQPARKGKYGQNLFWSWGSPSITYNGGDASTSWYNQNKYYNYKTFQSNDPSQMVGHFTAMIWKSSTSVGFGYTQGAEQGGFGIYVVANYYPTPNVIGDYAQNVPKPL